MSNEIAKDTCSSSVGEHPARRRVPRRPAQVLVLGLVLLSSLAVPWLGFWARSSREPLRSVGFPKTVDAPSVAGGALAADSIGRDWPALFGPDGDSRSREGRLSFPPVDQFWPRLAWERPVGTAYASPVAAAGRVYAFSRCDDREQVESLGIDDGERLWATSWPTSFRCRYEYSDGPYSTPLIVGDRLLVVGAEGRLVCLSVSDGAVLWTRDLRSDFGQPTGSYPFGAGLFERDGRVYLNVGASESGAGVVAFDLRTGATLWTATDHGAAFTTPRWMEFADRALLLVFTDVGLVALEPSTGHEWWTYPFRSRVADTVTAVSPLVQGKRVILVAGQGAGAVCLEIESAGNPREVWHGRRSLDSIFNTLVPHGGGVFGFAAMRQGGAPLRSIDAATGEIVWEQATELDRGQALVAGELMFVLGERGHFGLLRLKGGPPYSLEVSSAPLLEAPCFSSPALHRGRLLVRNERRLLCFDLRPRK